MSKRGRTHGPMLRSRSLEEKAIEARAAGNDVLPLIARGEIVVPIEATYSHAYAVQAYGHISNGGKIVLVR